MSHVGRTFEVMTHARLPATRATVRSQPRPRLELAGAPSVDEACHWLASTPTLDEVAAALRHLRLVQRDLSETIELLRQHALIALGERDLNAAPQGTSIDDEPF